MQKLGRPGKMAQLLGLLNGNISFAALKPPRFLIAFFDGKIYQIEGLKLEEKAFNDWCKMNVRETDSLQVFEEKRSDVKPEDFQCIGSDKGAILLPKHKDPEIRPKVEKQVREQFHLAEQIQIKPKQIKQEEKEVKEEIAVMPTRKTSGLMSEYGITWAVSDNSLYTDNKNYSPLR